MTENILKGPEIKYDVNSTLGEFLFNRAKQLGDSICQIDAALNKTETFSSVRQRSVRTALELKRRNINENDVVAFCSKVTLDNLIPIVATCYLGAKVANLDPSLSMRHTSHLLSLVLPKIIFVEEESVSLIEESLQNAKLNSEIIVFGESSKYSTFSDFTKPKDNEEEFRPTKVDIHDTAVIFFSSGTTGLPKAICHSHYSFLNLGHSFYETDAKCHVILSFTSFYWISGMLLFITSFIAGGCRVFYGVMEAEKTFSVIEKYKVTLMFLAPIYTYKLTNFEHIYRYNTSSLNTIFIGGSCISTTQLKNMRAIFKNVNVIFGYGLTEVGLGTTFDPLKDREFISKNTNSCGRPAPGTRIKVVDLSTGQPLGPNQKGEIFIKTPSAMKGYYRVDNSATFDSDGFLKTGDIGYYDDDYCFYVIERLKEMFKYTYLHVIPSSLEAVLLEHPAVEEAVVFGTPTVEEVGELPTAAVILKKGCTVSKEEIEAFVAERVADHEKLRGGVVFVESLQKTPSGKLKRKEIRNEILTQLGISRL